MTSSALYAPVCTATLNGRDLRFFKAPVAEPRLPWISWDDLVICLGYPRATRREMKARLRIDWPGNTRTVAAQGGVTTIAPDWMGRGLVATAEELGCCRAPVAKDYEREAGAALSALCRGLGSAEARVQFAIEACANSRREAA